MESNRGFTLVELIVVIAVIGVLAGAIILGLNPLTQFKKTRDAERKSNLREIKTALALYYSIHGEYPADSGGAIVGCDPGACSWGEKWELDTVVYMKILPADPKADNPQYQYNASADQNSFYLIATLEIEDDPDAAKSQAQCGAGSGDEYVVCSD